MADFGLSRDVYVSGFYAANTSTARPMKWLAPEAIFDQKYTEKSDVVSNFSFLLSCHNIRGHVMCSNTCKNIQQILDLNFSERVTHTYLSYIILRKKEEVLYTN